MDITYYYNDWIAIGNIIKNMFGEEGRALFHKVSSFYPNYDYDETDREYSVMIIGRYRYNSDRLFEIAAEYKLISPIKNNFEKKRDNYRCVAYLFSYIRLCKLYAKTSSWA